MIDVCLLGTGGMMPLPNRWLSALLLRSQRDVVLVDCGEGTQISWRYAHWNFRDVGTIALTHLHADHVAGIAGVLFMIAHSNRAEDLTIFGPPGTRQVVQALTIVVPRLPFTVLIEELSGGETRTLSDGLELSALAVSHRIPCLAYRFRRQRAPKFDVSRAQELDIPVTIWRKLQSGASVALGDRMITPEQVLGPARRGLTVGFVTDTRTTTDIADFVRDADLLICEGTYGDPSLHERAHAFGHMTFDQAASIARDAHAGRLILTHFSPSVLDPENDLHHAQAIFPNSTIGQTHETITLAFADT